MIEPFNYTMKAPNPGALREEAETLTWLADLIDASEESPFDMQGVAMAIIERYTTANITFEFAEAALAAIGCDWPDAPEITIVVMAPQGAGKTQLEDWLRDNPPMIREAHQPKARRARIRILTAQALGD